MTLGVTLNWVTGWNIIIYTRVTSKQLNFVLFIYQTHEFVFEYSHEFSAHNLKLPRLHFNFKLSDIFFKLTVYCNIVLSRKYQVLLDLNTLIFRFIKLLANTKL